MPPGPLPKPDARRRNAPTVPTTNLPAGGRKGRAPKVPSAYQLGAAGKAWWKWAWSTPQAMAWDSGALYLIARRAQLEDELAAVHTAEGLDLGELLQAAGVVEIQNQLNFILRSLQSRATGATTLMREMREIDDRLGLTPKGMASLRWTIVKDTDAGATSKPTAAKKTGPKLASVHRIRAVDPAAG